MSQTEAAAGLPEPRRTAAVAAVLIAMTLVVLDAGVVNLALTTIGQSLQVTPAQSLLVVTAYQATIVMILLPFGALGERYGYRRVFVAGVATFTGASALCALSPSLTWLVCARALQGVGGGAVMALGIALLRASVPRERIGAAIGWNALTVALASAVAPSLGALILSGADWRWLFAINLPVGGFALLASRALPNPAATARTLDIVSMSLNAAMFGLFVVALEGLPSAPVFAAVCGAASGLALAVLVRREAPKIAPLIPFDLLRSRSFRLSVIASVCCFAGQSAGLLAMTFHLQHDLGQTPLTAGLYLTAWPLSVAGAAMLAGRAADRMDTAWLCALGGACLAAGLVGAAAWPPQVDARPIAGFAILCGLGFGFFQTPNNRNMLLAAPADRSGAAGGVQGTARLTGQTLGALMMSGLYQFTATDAAARVGLAVAAVCALAAGVVSIWRRRSVLADGACPIHPPLCGGPSLSPARRKREWGGPRSAGPGA